MAIILLFMNTVLINPNLVLYIYPSAITYCIFCSCQPITKGSEKSAPCHAKEMLVRKGTNGETWVQHVLDGLVSTLTEIALMR